LIEKYIQTLSISKREDAYGASRFIAGQITYYKEKIEDMEEQLADFRRKEGIYLATNETTLVNSIKGYIEEIENVEMEIKRVEARKKKIEQQISGETPYTVAMMESGGGDSLPARLKSLQQRLQVLLTKYTENYPEVIRTRIEIETINKQITAGKQTMASSEQAAEGTGYGMSMMNPIYQQLKEELFNAETELDSFQAKKEILVIRSERAESELKDIPKNKKELANLERDRETYQTLYGQLLAKLGQAEVNEQVEVQSKGETFKVIERAGLPGRPASPDRIMLIILGIFAGIAAGIGIVLLMEKLDSSIRDVDVLKSRFGVKVLAIIPGIVTEKETARKRKNDMAVYTFSAIYLLIIGGVFIKEFINRFL
jgi:polysaccharide chain length determinant protein (PEP-CTERM system associated)